MNDFKASDRRRPVRGLSSSGGAGLEDVDELREALEADITAWAEHWNANPRPYIWTKTADQILTNLARYCERISDSGH